MPPQTTIPPFASARSAAGTSGPTGAKTIAASSLSGGISSEPPAHFAPNFFAASWLALSPGRVNAKSSALIKRNLSDQARGVTKTINAEPMRLARFAQRPITQQARAKQRRGLDIVVTIGQPKTKPRVGDGKLGITAIDGVASETRVVAKIFAVGPTISAFPICPAKPRNADAIADGEFFNTFADLFDAPDNLMPRNQ